MSEGSETTQILTVSGLCAMVGRHFKQHFEGLFLQGEISGLTRPASGHLYFQIKDANASISGIMFRGSASKLPFNLEEGQEYIFRGALKIYEKRGQTQFDAYYAEPVGIGAAKAAYEQLKLKLSSEGLFDEAAKKPIPFLPYRVGVVTSPSGAVVRDIIKTINKKFPKTRLLIYPALIQGDQAAQQIAAGVDYLDGTDCDVIIVARGGGSFEELSVFNDEHLARTIFACKTPVISAVGHETDFTICDFVSDLRAATPTAAAEAAVPYWADLNEALIRHQKNLASRFDDRLKFFRMRVSMLTRHLSEPGGIIKNFSQKVDESLFALEKRITMLLGAKRKGLDGFLLRVGRTSPSIKIQSARSRIEALRLKSEQLTEKRVSEAGHRLALNIEKLNLLNPAAMLKRGLVKVRSARNLRGLTSVKEVRRGQMLSIEMMDGRVEAKAQEIVPFNQTEQPELTD